MSKQHEEIAAELTAALVGQLKPVESMHVGTVAKDIAAAYGTIYQAVRAAGLAQAKQDFSSMSS